MVDSYKVVKVCLFVPSNGHEFMTFHCIVENLSGDRLYLDSNVGCDVNGFSQETVMNYKKNLCLIMLINGSSFRDIILLKYLDATSYYVFFGNTVTIHITK